MEIIIDMLCIAGITLGCAVPFVVGILIIYWKKKDIPTPPRQPTGGIKPPKGKGR
jgi:hypothetical protein